MKTLLLLIALMLGGLLGFIRVLKDGRFLNYLDAHPHPVYVPKAEYYIGQSFALFGNLKEATTYFTRIPERYPQSPLAEVASYRYLTSLDDMGQIPKEAMISLYEMYFSSYPTGEYTEMVRGKIAGIRSR